MGSTLQDQFLKMGLVDKKQVEKVKKAQHQKKIDKKSKNITTESKVQAQQALVEKKQRSMLANRKKNEEAKEQETAARIRQLIETSRLSMSNGETLYNFTDNNKIKRLYLQKDTVEQLSNGTLAIVKQAGEYQIVPARIAQEVESFNKNLVVVHHSSGKNSPVDEDPYDQFKIPDDLMW
jgi:hypothetical protein